MNHKKIFILLLSLVVFANLVLAVPTTFNVNGKLKDAGNLNTKKEIILY